MSKKHIKKLAAASYTRNLLDAKKVGRVSKLLRRPDLKLYIKALKNIESKRKIKVYIPNISVKTIELGKLIKRAFPDKLIVYESDPSLILGVRIVSNDLVYDFNLKNTFEELSSYIENQYD